MPSPTAERVSASTATPFAVAAASPFAIARDRATSSGSAADALGHGSSPRQSARAAIAAAAAHAAPREQAFNVLPPRTASFRAPAEEWASASFPLRFSGSPSLPLSASPFSASPFAAVLGAPQPPQEPDGAAAHARPQAMAASPFSAVAMLGYSQQNPAPADVLGGQDSGENMQAAAQTHGDKRSAGDAGARRVSGKAMSIKTADFDMVPHFTFSSCAAGGISYQGRRDANEDRMAYSHALLTWTSGGWNVCPNALKGVASMTPTEMQSEDPLDSSRGAINNPDSYHLFAVYDGHGGEDVVEFAKGNMLRFVAQSLQEAVLEQQAAVPVEVPRLSADAVLLQRQVNVASSCAHPQPWPSPPTSQSSSPCQSKPANSSPWDALPSASRAAPFPSQPDAQQPAACADPLQGADAFLRDSQRGSAAAGDSVDKAISRSASSFADAAFLRLAVHRGLFGRGLRRYHSLIHHCSKPKTPRSSVRTPAASLKPHVKELACKKTISAAIAEAVHRAFCRLDEDITDKLPSAKTQGTTALAAVVGSKTIIIGNTGDSRAVICRAGESIQISVDQTPAREDEVKRVNDLGGYVIRASGARVMGVLAMTRALGDVGLRPYVIPNPETFVHRRTVDDELLILATDGLWDIVSNEVACRLCRRALYKAQLKGHSPNKVACMAAKCLAMHAIRQGSQDNVTVVVLDLLRSSMHIPGSGGFTSGSRWSSKEGEKSAKTSPFQSNDGASPTNNKLPPDSDAPVTDASDVSDLPASIAAQRSSSGTEATVEVSASPRKVETAVDVPVAIATASPSPASVLGSWRFQTPSDCMLGRSPFQQDDAAPAPSPFAGASTAPFPDARSSDAAPAVAPIPLRPRPHPQFTRTFTYRAPQAADDQSARVAAGTIDHVARFPMAGALVSSDSVASEPICNGSDPENAEGTQLRRYQTMMAPEEWRRAGTSTQPVTSTLNSSQSLAGPDVFVHLEPSHLSDWS